MLLEFTLPSAKNTPSNQRPFTSTLPSHMLSEGQRLSQLWLCSWVKKPKNGKNNNFEMYYTLKLRVIVCSSLENIAHSVLLSHRSPRHKHWLSECNSKLKKVTKGGRKGGGDLSGRSWRRLLPWRMWPVHRQRYLYTAQAWRGCSAG